MVLSNIDKERLQRLLAEWSRIKYQMIQLEARKNDIKEIVNDIMTQENENNLTIEDYIITRKLQKRSFISKKDIPTDLWSRYSKTTEFNVFQIKRI